MGLVEGALIERFGPYAGWAHNTLFIAELSSHKVPLRRFACMFLCCRHPCAAWRCSPCPRHDVCEEPHLTDMVAAANCAALKQPLLASDTCVQAASLQIALRYSFAHQRQMH